MIKFDEYGSVRTFCDLPFQHVKVNVNGDVAMCCYQGRFLGNLLDQPLAEVWNGPLAQAVRAETAAGRLHPACREWGGCPHVNTGLSARREAKYHRRLPISVEIDLPSTHCNIGGESPSADNPACVMCPRNFEKFRSHPFWAKDNTLAIAGRLRPLMPRIELLSVLGVAEPFWRGKLFEVFDVLGFRDHRHRAFFWTFTNGSVFGDEAQARFLDYTHSSLLYVSIDAATRETYRKIRRRDFLDTIRRNLTAYHRRRQPFQKFYCYHNVNALNYHEMALMVDFAGEVGADRVQFNPTHDAGGMSEVADILVSRDTLPDFEAAQARAAERARELGVEMEMVREFAQVVGPPLVQLEVPK